MWRKAVLRHDARLNIVWDGNSLVVGQGGIAPATLVQNALTAMGRDAITANIGVSGQTWRMMDGLDGQSASDAKGAYYPGRTNVLVLWETTNSVVNAGRSAAQTAGDAQAYLQHRLAEHPDWLPIMLTALPRSPTGATQAQVDTYNATLSAANALIAAACRGWGAKALVDVRCKGSPFRLASFTPADFANDAQLWSDTYTHLSTAGYQVIANLVLRAIIGLSPR